jgi:SNF2 family DNA or RNA helicase
MERQAFTEIEGKPVTAVNAGVLLGKLLQASLFGMYSEGSAVELDFSPRLKVLKEVIEACNEKVIVFVPFTGALNRFYDELKSSWTVEVVDGSVAANKRNRIFKDFQTGTNPRIILAHPGTMAHGLTLTAATTIIWAAPVTSTETFLQANARISRPGQIHTAHIVMLWGSKVECRLYQTLKDRRKLQDLVLELAKERGKR